MNHKQFKLGIQKVTMKKVVMLVSGPCDEEINPDQRVINEAEALSQAGYAVEIFAWDRELRSKSVEYYGNCKVERIGIVSTFGKGLNQVWGFARFYIKLIVKMIKADFDVIHCHDLDTLLPGFIVARLKKKKLVFDSHEYYPAIMVDQKMLILAKLATKIQNFIVKRSDLVIVVNEYLKKIFLNVNSNVRVIMNCKDLNEFNSRFIDEKYHKHVSKNKKSFLYIGTLMDGRNLFELIDIFKNSNATFLIGGRGQLMNKIKKLTKSSNNIHFIGTVPSKDVPRYTAASDYIIAIYNSKSLNNDIAGPPNKLFEAIAAGKPIITSKNGPTGELVKKIGCGIVVDPDNKQEIRRIINKTIYDESLQQKLCRKSIEAQKMYNWKEESKKLIEAYRYL